VLLEADYSKNVHARLRTPVQVAIAGRDNSALAIKPAETAAAGSAVVALLYISTELLRSRPCNACHGQGIGGAPQGRRQGRLGCAHAQGKATLYEHALKGFRAARA